MNEKLYTIPLNAAVNANDECPFCFIERNVEQDLLDYCIGSGSSYMEKDMRAITDEKGFCKDHFNKMFHYGNALGNAWILKTHYLKAIKDMKTTFKGCKPAKLSLGEKLSKSGEMKNAVGIWADKRKCSCYICEEFAKTYDRYMDTFFYLYKEDPAFREKLINGKGFCITHFGDMCEASVRHLKEKDQEQFFNDMFPVMEKNMERLYEDISWFIEKFDYKNVNADWKDSKDALQRGMQKLKGGYPADGYYQMKK